MNIWEQWGTQNHQKHLEMEHSFSLFLDVMQDRASSLYCEYVKFHTTVLQILWSLNSAVWI
jgi:hypothetical protein